LDYIGDNTEKISGEKAWFFEFISAIIAPINIDGRVNDGYNK
jgi:hypothetical protein